MPPPCQHVYSARVFGASYSTFVLFTAECGKCERPSQANRYAGERSGGEQRKLHAILEFVVPFAAAALHFANRVKLGCGDVRVSAQQQSSGWYDTRVQGIDWDATLLVFGALKREPSRLGEEIEDGLPFAGGALIDLCPCLRRFHERLLLLPIQLSFAGRSFGARETRGGSQHARRMISRSISAGNKQVITGSSSGRESQDGVGGEQTATKLHFWPCRRMAIPTARSTTISVLL